MLSLRERVRGTFDGLPPTFWVLFWSTLVNRAASFVGTFLALHLKQNLGLSQAEAGRIVGLWGLGSVLAAPLGGLLTDRVGRRITMLLGLTLGGLSVVALAFYTNPRGIPLLALIGGATQSLFFPSSSAAVADLVKPEHRQRAYGHLYWVANLGLASGYFVAGFVPSLTSLFLADAGTTFLCALMVAWRVPETRPCLPSHQQHSAWRSSAVMLRDGPFMGFVGLHLCALMVFTQFQLALPLDMAAHGSGPQRFSWLMAFNCIGVVLLQPWMTPLLQRFDHSRLLAVSSLLVGVGYGLNAAVSTFPLYLLGSAFWTVGEVVGFPAASALVADLSPTALRGTYQGAFSMAWGVGMTLSPVVGGELMQRFGAPLLWQFCLVISVLVALGHLLAGPARRRRVLAGPDSAQPL